MGQIEIFLIVFFLISVAFIAINMHYKRYYTRRYLALLHVVRLLLNEITKVGDEEYITDILKIVNLHLEENFNIEKGEK